MKTHKLFESKSHTWLMFGRDDEKPNEIIDTNQYLYPFHLKMQNSAGIINAFRQGIY
jgi:hypothetical protein